MQCSSETNSDTERKRLSKKSISCDHLLVFHECKEIKKLTIITLRASSPKRASSEASREGWRKSSSVDLESPLECRASVSPLECCPSVSPLECYPSVSPHGCPQDGEFARRLLTNVQTMPYSYFR